MSYGFLTFDATLVTSYWTHQRCCMEPLGEKKISQLTWTPFLDKEETWRQKAAITCDKMSPAAQDADITINNGIKCHIYNENQWQQSRKRNLSPSKQPLLKKKKYCFIPWIFNHTIKIYNRCICSSHIQSEDATASHSVCWAQMNDWST